MFVDRAQIKVKGGDGGDGCCSFRREKYVPKGGPNGGDGGDGGSVYLVADEGEQSLVDLVYNRHFQAERGMHGKGKDMYGRKGRDLLIRIPVGTVVRDSETGEIIADLDAKGSKLLIAAGGKGGKGNKHFLSNANKAPRQHEPGAPGEEREIDLELKVIADVGLVGYPNAGKSTFLTAVSSATPKIAPYPFTTLHPIVGVHEFPDLQKITVADIPGLIEGAHKNVGLGHEFLRHIERTKVLIYVLDVPGTEGRNPADDFRALQNELDLYMKGLSKRKAVVAANKMDLPGAQQRLRKLRRELKGYRIIPVSALEKRNTSKVMDAVREIL